MSDNQPPEPDVVTATMAEIYVQQGYYDKAAAIYRKLLADQPQRDDLRRALQQAEQLARKAGRRQDLARLMGQWLELEMRYRMVRRLGRLKATGRKHHRPQS